MAVSMVSNIVSRFADESLLEPNDLIRGEIWDELAGFRKQKKESSDPHFFPFQQILDFHKYNQLGSRIQKKEAAQLVK
jgi:hypothetical protein